ncbi:MAG: fatty-acid desaturase [Parasphingorhabdus sp.]|jgi:fatty-acid desaturase
MAKSTFVKTLLKEPYYGYQNRDGSTKIPSYKEVIKQLLSSINVFGTQRQRTVFTMFFFLDLTAICALIFFTNYLTVYGVLYAIIVGLVAGHIYNTIWHHRYCSHSAFKLVNPKYALLFSWTDPLFFSEDNYALPHLVHHAKADKAGDPYGPQIGWLASFLGPYINTSIDADISEDSFERIKKRISHINLKTVNYAHFKRHGVIEGYSGFLSRKVVAQILWIGFSYYLGGVVFVFAYLTAVFITISIVLP